MEDKKTFYPENKLSFSDKQHVWVRGHPRTEGDGSPESKKKLQTEWVGEIEQKIHKQIEDNRLRSIRPDEECNLYVTFRILKSLSISSNTDKFLDTTPSDIDNLLKPLFDALKKRGKSVALFYLMEDDRQIRGTRSEREMVDKEGQDGVRIKYVLTKTFIIDDVQEIKKKEDSPAGTPGHLLLETYRSYWNYPMQHITAHEIMKKSKGKEVLRGPYTFIDNERGRLFLAEQGGKYAKLIPPGYDWKGMKGKRVSGCMVFMKEIEKGREEEDGPKEPYHWLTKW